MLTYIPAALVLLLVLVALPLKPTPRRRDRYYD